MKKRSFWFITILMTLALLGVFVMQLYYIREAYNLKSQLFDQQVNQTLTTVVGKLQKRNAYNYYSRKEARDKRQRVMDLEQRELQVADAKKNYETLLDRNRLSHQRQIEAELISQDSVIRSFYLKPVILSESDFKAADATNGRSSNSPVRLDVYANVDENFNIVSGSISTKFTPSGRRTLNFNGGKLPDTIRYVAKDPNTSRIVLISLATMQADMKTKFKKEDFLARREFEQKVRFLKSDSAVVYTSNLSRVEDVAKEMSQPNLPLDKRIDFSQLKPLLKKEFKNSNINLPFAYSVSLAQKDSVLFVSNGKAQNTFNPANTYATNLDNNGLFRDPGVLMISFPNKNSAILSNLTATVASSIGLLLVLVFIFSYTLYAILKQKKLSEMKTDFINNMTHEFKTPVSTIMIASEALKDPDVSEDKTRLKRLADIIYDENVRLGNHIERVLSIARLEKKEHSMDNSDVDMNDLILVVIDSMDLQLQKKNAKVTLKLDAEQSTVFGDELHLSNVIYNLIDNANKYSLDSPEITVSTKNTSDNLIIKITDNGIGMSKEHSKKIFDQFYRVPTGNLHDVKGFGLGLNYVQDIVKRLNGRIKVDSEKGKGTTFEILLPLLAI
ncbi:two-component system phosphate regulon sensor histidine kinase PhoR [Pedobacter sp. UYP30]|uniref:sensor histidine kinase n=1 Tax=Pedobacter sp. UYP30 TaxID=1756400 RepID=UPI003390A629